jgi:hypothetical protein
MSVVPWDKLNPADSPYVKLFGLIGIPFAAGIINLRKDCLLGLVYPKVLQT